MSEDGAKSNQQDDDLLNIADDSLMDDSMGDESDDDDVIEMEQENGLPVEKKTADENEQEHINEKPIVKDLATTVPRVSGARRVLGVLIAIVLGMGLILGGLFIGKAVKKSATNGDGSGSSLTGPALLGGGGGMPVDNVALMAQDDKLALAFLKQHNVQENSCYSPLSIRYALEMMSAGAGGETKAQIDSLLGGLTATRYEAVQDHLGMANAFWVSTGWQDKIKSEFPASLKETMGAEMIVDDVTSAQNMNAWVEKNTLGLIQDVMSDEEIQALRAALVNVLAIDMDWETQFMPEMTSGQFFDFDKLDITNDLEIDVDENKYTTMRRYGGQDIYYNLAADATVLAQDLKEYNGTKLQFVAIMPKDLTSYIENVSNADINRLLAGLRVAVRQNDTYDFSFTAYIPKFSMESGIDDLIGGLRELGVTDAFSLEKADFSKIVGKEEFAVLTMMHKTKFDFSEEGIKAAAITLGGMGAAGGPGPIPSSVDIVVSINKPFIYLVRDVKTGEIWFVGTVYEPNHWVDDKDQYVWR